MTPFSNRFKDAFSLCFYLLVIVYEDPQHILDFLFPIGRVSPLVSLYLYLLQII